MQVRFIKEVQKRTAVIFIPEPVTDEEIEVLANEWPEHLRTVAVTCYREMRDKMIKK